MPNHAVVDPETWLEQRKALLAKEKEFTKLRDGLAAERRALPWKKVEKRYEFEGPDGRETLADLFAGRSQLIVYHFMFDPTWEEGCKSCSLGADHYEPSIAHLKARDVSMVTVSLAPLAKLEAFQKRMGWQMKWVSSFGSEFNKDFGVSFSDEEREAGNAFYNYGSGGFPVSEAPGLSVFARDQAGDVFHTYSSYGRGLELILGVYNLLDVVPKGRDEDSLPYPMAWVRHHDAYDNAEFVDPYVSEIAPAAGSDD